MGLRLGNYYNINDDLIGVTFNFTDGKFIKIISIIEEMVIYRTEEIKKYPNFLTVPDFENYLNNEMPTVESIS